MHVHLILTHNWECILKSEKYYKCPRHDRTKNCELQFIFPAAQLAAARRATRHT